MLDFQIKFFFQSVKLPKIFIFIQNKIALSFLGKSTLTSYWRDGWEPA